MDAGPSDNSDFCRYSLCSADIRWTTRHAEQRAMELEKSNGILEFIPERFLVDGNVSNVTTTNAQLVLHESTRQSLSGSKSNVRIWLVRTLGAALRSEQIP
mmetsp:Transcript_14793/g.41231  ORF Transcript_14793/g.41231 Transcript_14793/m.41231 type:complete len:101 (-) Transcript_14793:586-888(-)